MRIDVGIDILKNEGYFRVRLFYFVLIVGRLSFRRKNEYGIFILEWNNKSIELHLNNDYDDEQSIVNLFASSIFSAMKISKLCVEVRAGKRDDAFFTMAVLQSARIVVNALLSVFKTRKGTEIYDRFIARYNRDELKLASSGIIEIKIADIIFNAVKKIAMDRKKGGKIIDNRA